MLEAPRALEDDRGASWCCTRCDSLIGSLPNPPQPAFSLGRKRGMSAYLVILLGGEGSFEVEADFYGQDRDDFVFTCEGREVRRIPMFEVGSISKEK